MQRHIVLIHGDSGSGKTTVGKGSAEEVDFNFFSNGMLYRLLTYYFVENEIEPSEAKESDLTNIVVEYKNGDLYLNEINVQCELKKQKIESKVADYAGILFLREFAKTILKEITKTGNWFLEGRALDKVIENPFMIIHLICDDEVRLQRALENVETSGRQNLLERDEKDKNRKVEPSGIVPGSVIIDTTYLSKDGAISQLLYISGLNHVKKISSF